MARLFATVAASALVAAHGYGRPADCYTEFQCIYEFNSGNAVVSWDLKNLCAAAPGYASSGKPVGAQGYVAQKVNSDGSLDPYPIYFSVCGNVQTACAPQLVESGITPLYSRGAAVQFFEPVCFTTPGPANGCPAQNTMCVDSTVSGPPPDQSNGVCDGNSPNPNPTDAGCVSCTGNCEVIAQPSLPAFTQIKGSDTSILPGAEGLNLTYPPVPAYASDNYECDVNPVTQLPYERQLTITLLCDKTVTKGLQKITLTEGPQCSYTIQATTASACSSKGDPFIVTIESFPDTPGKNFGYTVLGVFLTGVVYFLYQFADNRGYLDGVKKFVPEMPSFLSFGGRGGVYGSGSYKGVSASSGTTATPISASAYGST